MLKDAGKQVQVQCIKQVNFQIRYLNYLALSLWCTMWFLIPTSINGDHYPKISSSDNSADSNSSNIAPRIVLCITFLVLGNRWRSPLMATTVVQTCFIFYTATMTNHNLWWNINSGWCKIWFNMESELCLCFCLIFKVFVTDFVIRSILLTF